MLYYMAALILGEKENSGLFPWAVRILHQGMLRNSYWLIAQNKQFFLKEEIILPFIINIICMFFYEVQVELALSRWLPSSTPLKSREQIVDFAICAAVSLSGHLLPVIWRRNLAWCWKKWHDKREMNAAYLSRAFTVERRSGVRID